MIGDGAKVQIDSVLADGRGELVEIRVDSILPIRLDHSCVHCKIRFTTCTIGPHQRRLPLKGWKPFADFVGVNHRLQSVSINMFPPQIYVG